MQISYISKELKGRLKNCIDKSISIQLIHNIESIIYDYMYEICDRPNQVKLKLMILHNHIEIQPLNLYTGLLLCGLSIPYIFVENKKKYEDENLIFLFNECNKELNIILKAPMRNINVEFEL